MPPSTIASAPSVARRRQKPGAENMPENMRCRFWPLVRAAWTWRQPPGRLLETARLRTRIEILRPRRAVRRAQPIYIHGWPTQAGRAPASSPLRTRTSLSTASVEWKVGQCSALPCPSTFEHCAGSMASEAAATSEAVEATACHGGATVLTESPWQADRRSATPGQ